MPKTNKLLFFLNIVIIAVIATIVAANAWNSPNSNPPYSTNQAMYINSSNNVGIGTTNPQGKLAIELLNDGWNGYDPIMKLSAWQDGVNNSGNGGAIDFYVNNQTSYYPSSRIIHTMSSGTGGELSFATTENYITTLPTRRLVIKGDGNVGIGTTAPTAKLEVAGQIKATGGTLIYQCPNGDPDWQRNQCVSQLTTNSQCLLVVGGGAESIADCALVGRMVAP